MKDWKDCPKWKDRPYSWMRCLNIIEMPILGELDRIIMSNEVGQLNLEACSFKMMSYWL